VACALRDEQIANIEKDGQVAERAQGLICASEQLAALSNASFLFYGLITTNLGVALLPLMESFLRFPVGASWERLTSLYDLSR
jgi:hypothetical protein